MPIYGRDWRASGDQWIKTEQGWQKMKSFKFLLDPLDLQPKPAQKLENENVLRENQNDGTFDDNNNNLDSNNDEFEFKEYVLNEHNEQPCVYLDVASTAPNRETSAPALTISEALVRLDMMGSALMLKRFNYVYKLTNVLIKEKLDQISGTAQGTIMMIINMMLNHVLNRRINIHLIKKLLTDLAKKIEKSNLNHIGSQKLWSHHLNLINRWLKRLENYEKRFWASKDNDQKCTTGFSTMPYECKLEIIKRINCGYDLVNLSKCNKEFHDIVSRECLLWRSLCYYKFTPSNILTVIKELNIGIENEDEISTNDDLDWKLLYFKLNRRHVPQEVFIDIIQKCSICKCLFWKETGHPCVALDDQEPIIESFTPQKLIKFLSS